MRTYLVAFTASNSTAILTDHVVIYEYPVEKANQETFEQILNAILKPSYVKKIISWSLIEE